MGNASKVRAARWPSKGTKGSIAGQGLPVSSNGTDPQEPFSTMPSPATTPTGAARTARWAGLGVLACLLAAWFAFGGFGSLAAARQGGVARSAGMGVNIEGVKDYARLSPFVDLMKSSRPWGRPDAPWEGQVRTDALGWPLEDAGVVVKVLQEDPGAPRTARRVLDPGVYRLTFQGRAAVEPVASSGVTVRALTHDPASRQSKAEVVVGPGATQLMLSFTGTSGGVRDVRLVPATSPPGQTFSDEFRAAVAPFGTLRLMDFLETNGNPVRRWSERTTPASATQAGERGAAWEYAVQLANELHKDIWINVPFHADDDYVRALAVLLKQSLAPGRAVYVEYSNELWNAVFPQTRANMEAAVAEAVAGDTTLTGGHRCTRAQFEASAQECNPHWAGYMRVGKRTVRIAQVFAEVFGPGALNDRVRVVYATQFADRSIAEQVLKNIATYRGKPSSFLYGVAAAPYFYLDPELARWSRLDAATVHASLEKSLERDVLPFLAPGVVRGEAFRKGAAYAGGDWTGASLKALADHYGLQSMAYEGGPDLRQEEGGQPAKFGASMDPRMGLLMERLLGQWFGCGNGLFVHYNLTSPYGRDGHWGLTNDPRDLKTPKYLAVAAAARRAATDFKRCS